MAVSTVYAARRRALCPPSDQPPESRPPSGLTAALVGLLRSGGSVVIVRCEWHMSEDSCLVVEIEADHERPDLLDDMSRRVVHLLNESIAAVTKDEPGD